MGNKLDQLPILKLAQGKLNIRKICEVVKSSFVMGACFHPPWWLATKEEQLIYVEMMGPWILPIWQRHGQWKAMPLLRIATSPVVKIFEISPTSKWLKRDEIGYFIVIIILKYLDTRCNHGQKLGAAHESLAPEERRYTLRPKDLCII